MHLRSNLAHIGGKEPKLCWEGGGGVMLGGPCGLS